MRNILYLTKKYWAKHRKNLLALVFSGMVMMAVVTAALLHVRAEFNRTLHSEYDSEGMFDVMLINASDSFLNRLAEMKMPEKTEVINVLGKVGIFGKEYTYGYADGEIDLAHIPFESGGLPENESEAAVSRGVMNAVGWYGKVGDTITLDGKEYKLSGVIGEKYDRRFGSETGPDAQYGDVSPTPIPVVFVGKPSGNAQTAYSITMFDGVVEGKEERETIFGMSTEKFLEMCHDEMGETAMWSVLTNNKDASASSLGQKSQEFRQNVRWLMVLAVIASVIAVLSVFAVLRIIFAERRNTNAMLRRVGLSKGKLSAMYAVECVIFTVIQSVVGAVLGILGYFAVHTYQMKALGYGDYSAFTKNPLVVGNTKNPFVTGLVISAGIMVAGYGISAVFEAVSGNGKRLGRLRRKTAEGCISSALSCKTVTAIQTVSLTLIVFGSMLGYMYYTDSGKDYMNYLAYEPAPTVELNDSLDMEIDNIAEYYSSAKPSVISMGNDYSGLPLTQNNFSSGFDDETVSKLGNVTATAELSNTFLIYDEQQIRDREIVMDSQEFKDGLTAVSDEEYKNFFEKGQIGSKYLYAVDTKLANEKVLEELEKYVVSGSIDASAVNSGKELVAVLDSGSGVFNVGDKVNVGSLMINDSFGIGGVSSCEAKIGAVAVIRFDDEAKDKVIRYAAKSKSGICLLTTQSGAEAMGIYGAAYTEILSDHHIDSGLVPAGADVTFTSLEEIKHKRFVEKATSIGGTIMLIILMSVLGFAAYFNGIGLKIRLKSYQISVLRALGTSESRLRRKLFLKNLKIPVISTAVAGAGVLGVQKFFAAQYDRMIAVAKPDEYGVITFDEATVEAQRSIIDKYFLNSEMWVVGTVKPLLVIFAAVAVITVLLTVINMRKLNGNISDAMNKGRKRQ